MNSPKKTLSICYILHNSSLGGAQKSLVETVLAFPKDEIVPFFILPKGEFNNKVEEYQWKKKTVLGIANFDHTQYSYYSGIRWLLLTREFVRIFFTIPVFFKIIKCKFDLIHLNEINLFWMLPILKLINFDTPIVLHVRAKVCNKNLLRTKIVNLVIKNYSNRIVAIDHNVSKTLECNKKLTVINNCYSEKSYNRVRCSSTYPSKKLRIGFIGTILESKGIFDLLKALSICIQRGLSVEIVVAGNFIKYNKIFNLMKLDRTLIREKIEYFILKENLDEYVKFIGYQDDLSMFYQKIDLLCFPSHLEAVGRPVFEAAYYGRPSIVALSDPDPEMFPDNIGIRVSPKNPSQLADAIEKFSSDKRFFEMTTVECIKWGSAKFNCKKNSQELVSLYRSLLCVNNYD